MSFYTSSFNLYSIAKANHLTRISLTMDQLETEVNDTVVINDVAPLIINNRTMVPVRFIAENMGAEVQWLNEEKK